MALTPTKTGSADKEKPGKISAEDDVILREIDEAVRKDDFDQFAKKYGVLLIGGIAAILLAFGGYLFWDSRQESKMEAQSEKLTAALDQVQAGNFPAASTAAGEVVDAGSSGARAAGLMLQAGAAIEQGDLEEAVRLYARVAADEDAPPAIRDLATIREIATNFDDRDPQDVIARLSRLAVPGNAFFGSAAELTAMAHLQAGNNSEAGTLFAAIAKDEDVPETLRARSRQMAGLLGVDAIEDPEQLLEDEGVTASDEDPAAAFEGAVDAGAAAAPGQ